MATDGKPDVKSQSERARSFIGGLIKMFEVRIEEEAAGAAAMQPRAKGAGRAPSAPPVPPTAPPTVAASVGKIPAAPPPPSAASAAPSDRKYASFTEALAPFKERFEQAAKVDSSQLDDERKAEVAVKKKAMATHLAASRDLYKQPAGEAEALKELSRANQTATELLTRRYRIDPRTKKQYEEKELTPTYDAGERREFVGKELRANYKDESRAHYEDARKQAQTADYMLSDGLIRDAEGRPVTVTGANAMYTSRLDDGTSHRFNGAAGHHSFATEGTATIGAGSREVVDGIVRTVTGDSGHYTPSAKNIHEYVEGMIEQGVKMIDNVTLFVPDPAKPGAHRPLGPEDKALYDDFRSVVDYYRTRAEKRRAGEDPGEFDRAIQGKIQKLGDREVFPGQKDAKVETLIDGYLIDASEWNKPNQDGVVLTGGAKALELIRQRFKQVYVPMKGPDGKNVTKVVPINGKSVPILFNGMPHLKKKLSSVDEMTTDDVNHFLGICYRIGFDKPPAGESPVRIEMDAQLFAQTGGNAAAIGVKEKFNEKLDQDRAERDKAFAAFTKERDDWIAEYRRTHPEASAEEVNAEAEKTFAARRAEHVGFDEEAASREGKLYVEMGGDGALVDMFGIHAPEEIETDLKYAWLVKGRITDDRRLDELLLQRTGATPADQWAVLEAPLDVKLLMLEDAAEETFLARVAAGWAAAQPAPAAPAAPPRPVAPPPAAAAGSGAGGASPNRYAMPDGAAASRYVMPAGAPAQNAMPPAGPPPRNAMPPVAPPPPPAAAAEASPNGYEMVGDGAGAAAAPAEAASPIRSSAPNDYVTTVTGLDDVLESAAAAAAGPAAEAPSAVRSSAPNDYVTAVPSIEEMLDGAGPASAESAAEAPSAVRSSAPNDYVTTVKGLDEALEEAEISTAELDDLEEAFSDDEDEDEDGDEEEREPEVAADKPAGGAAPNPYVTEVKGLGDAPPGVQSAPAGGAVPNPYVTEVKGLGDAAPGGRPAPAARVEEEDEFSDDEDEDEDEEDSEPLAARAPEPAARPAPPVQPRRDEPERLEKIDLRKVKKGTKVDPNRKVYEELGGDPALLEQLLEAWDRNNAATVGRLKELEKARNQLKQRLKGAAELETELQQLDAEQAAERKTLQATLDATRPVLADLSDKAFTAELKVDLLQRPEGQAEALAAIAERNTRRRAKD